MYKGLVEKVLLKSYRLLKKLRIDLLEEFFSLEIQTKQPNYIRFKERIHHSYQICLEDLR